MNTRGPRAPVEFPTASRCTRILIDAIVASGREPQAAARDDVAPVPIGHDQGAKDDAGF